MEWININDKKPTDLPDYEEYDFFLCAVEKGGILTRLCNYIGDSFVPDGDFGADNRVKFWMPLPEVPLR